MVSKRQITLGHLQLNRQAKENVLECLDNNRLSRGKYTERFEKMFAAEHDCRYGVFMNSGTSALQVALAALKEMYNYKDGDEVIVPATTFIATSNIVLQNNMKPVFVDVDPLTFNIDVHKISAAVTSRTRCIIPVHLFGLPADMTSITMLAKGFGLQVIEDSCETMFAHHRYKRVGSFGDIACFSTYVAHLIVGGVGGIVTTNNKALDELCRSLMAHGRDSIYTSIDDDDFKPDDPDYSRLMKEMVERRYKFDRIGFSYRATELEAAIALAELERWRPNIMTRQANASYLTRKLADLKQIQTPTIPNGYEHSFMMFPMVVARGFGRDGLLMHLEKNGIETRLMFPLLSQPIYRKLFPGQEQDYPVAKMLTECGFFIGMHQHLTTDDMDYISQVIHGYYND